MSDVFRYECVMYSISTVIKILTLIVIRVKFVIKYTLNDLYYCDHVRDYLELSFLFHPIKMYQNSKYKPIQHVKAKFKTTVFILLF